MAETDTISELFSRDPVDGFSDEELAAMVSRLRQARAQYNLGATQAGNPKKVAPKKVKPDPIPIDLSALGLI